MVADVVVAAAAAVDVAAVDGIAAAEAVAYGTRMGGNLDCYGVYWDYSRVSCSRLDEGDGDPAVMLDEWDGVYVERAEEDAG